MKHIIIDINGIVQGVGFRPFVHRLAKKHNIDGWCKNTVKGLSIEACGRDTDIDAFTEGLKAASPAPCGIKSFSITPLRGAADTKGFNILKSDSYGTLKTYIAPDMAICPNCIREMDDKKDKRYRFPFINCTLCGPRFTIINDLPYDRKMTAMASFPMCPECEAEYNDIDTRRYHAQPDCCKNCGPALTFLSADQKDSSKDPLTAAKAYIKSGKTVAIKGLGGFHLACDAKCEAAIKRLRRLKQRDERPFALMAKDVESARKYVEISPDEERLLKSPAAPIVLLKKRADTNELSDIISPTKELGIMLAYTPLHRLLMEDFELLMMTSMNKNSLPIICDAKKDDDLTSLADGILTHNRDIINRCDDSLLRVIDGSEYFIRRSRGYVPGPLELSAEIDGILALGAEQKASFCIGRDREAFLSQHIGDLKNIETFDHYTDQIERFKTLFGISIKQLVSDFHPDYMSSGYANELGHKTGIPVAKVWHHHAHMASCMADNGILERAIALTWDGTGLGPDGFIWGGECLFGDYKSFTRLGSIRAIRLPGGDICTKEISRTAYSLLYDAGMDEHADFSFPESLPEMLNKDLNCPPSSGLGRLFDGTYTILTGRDTVTYEGQGAVLLEALAEDAKAPFPMSFYEDFDTLIFDTRPLIKSIIEEKEKGASPSELSARFHATLCEIAKAQCIHSRKLTGVKKVVLSGGCFQNRLLLSSVRSSLSSAGFEVFIHRRVAANDEGLSLGQAMIAAHKGGEYVPCNAISHKGNG